MARRTQRPHRQPHRVHHPRDRLLGADAAPRHPRRHAASTHHRLEPDHRLPAHLRPRRLLLRDAAPPHLHHARPLLRLLRDRCRHHQAPLHHRRLRGVPHARAPRRDLHQWLDPPPRPALADTPSTHLLQYRPRRAALLLEEIVQGGHLGAAPLRRHLRRPHACPPHHHAAPPPPSQREGTVTSAAEERPHMFSRRASHRTDGFQLHHQRIRRPPSAEVASPNPASDSEHDTSGSRKNAGTIPCSCGTNTA
jgi:hypothetical protein